MNNPTISDEVLSAFLDAELPEQQMEQIREALLEDDNLANRLADLAMVDEVIATKYDEINQQPLPAAINELLAAIPEEKASVTAIQAAENFSENTASQPDLNTTHSSESKSNVVSLWQRTKNSTNKPFALAASIAVAAGLFATIFSQTNNLSGDNWQEVAQILEQKTSGNEQTLANGKTIKTQLTFNNQQGNFCRQYDVSSEKDIERNIACRVNQEWELALTVIEQKAVQKAEQEQAKQNYQTATSNSMLRDQIDNMAAGDFLDKQQEQQVINNRWAK
ncbi:anti-sigma factor family protein [Pseudocolwellia sp. HL-MZ19]|uniref:anti-sigma factor family protein n=1 Tax=unclassified Pseudocolwellia TaxID=2848178 RepID=UPI003CF1B2CB